MSILLPEPSMSILTPGEDLDLLVTRAEGLQINIITIPKKLNRSDTTSTPPKASQIFEGIVTSLKLETLKSMT
jgi:hypothetical protein